MRVDRDELATPIFFRYLCRHTSKEIGLDEHIRPNPRRVFLRVATLSDLNVELSKSRRAFVTIPELADQDSPLPWGWTCAIQDRFRDLRCTVRDLLLSAALDLKTGLPPFMRENPCIMEPVLAHVARIRALLEANSGERADVYDPDLQTTFHVVVHEHRALRNDESAEGADVADSAPSGFIGGRRGSTWEVFGDPGRCPQGLPTRDLAGVAAFILSGRCRSVVLLTGAGISTASGIPSYRGSAGLWRTVRPGLLSATGAQRARIERDPEWVAHVELFQENPVPFFEVKREFVRGLARGRWLPTAAHHVVALLQRHGLLTRVLTQNIDGLHQQSGVPPELVTEIHGSTRTAHCQACESHVSLEKYAALVEAHVKDITGSDPGAPAQSTAGGLPCPECGLKSVRPDTVLFGEEVNPAFKDVFRDELPKADLLIVVGTTLMVAPAATAPIEVSPECVRLVVNDRRVGENVGMVFDEPESQRDVMVEADIDAALTELARLLGWLPELRAITGSAAARAAASSA